MITATPSSAFHTEQTDRRIDAPLISFEIPMELARLRAERAYDVEGHAGRTLTKYPDLRVVLETMKPGARLLLHETAERMTLQIMLGRLRVRTDQGGSCELSDGSFAAFDAARVHAIESLDECAFLLTLAWPPAAHRAGGSEDEETNGGGI